MQRSELLNSLYAIADEVPVGAGVAAPPSPVAGIAVPDSRLAREATAVAARAEAPEIFNHSIRSFFFSQLASKAGRIDHDVELVYVATILHDVGLTEAHMSERERFEVDGANVARDLVKRHDAADNRSDLVWDAVVMHYSSELAKWKQPEVQLVNAGIAVDFGYGLGDLAREDVVAVLMAAPRTGFVPAFLAAVTAVATRKPFATGNTFVTDVAYRTIPGFQLPNFCDSFSEAPFLPYESSA